MTAELAFQFVLLCGYAALIVALVRLALEQRKLLKSMRGDRNIKEADR